jgi:DNA-binding SARP family transcriptional activator
MNAPAAPPSEPEIEVAVLGPIEIRGAARAFCRASARELVVYLAFHRHGVRNDVWGAALWPDRCVAPSTLHSTASVARRALGRAGNGVEHLPRSGRLLRLGDAVRTDVERFSRAAADPDPAAWREALGLVRGRLFDGLTLIDWAILEGTQAQVESMVVDTALKGAEHALLLGRGEEAEWMIRRALRVCPFDERLYGALLEAAEVMGNRVGMGLAVAELRRVTGDGGPPGTVASVSERARRWAPAAGGGPARL